MGEIIGPRLGREGAFVPCPECPLSHPLMKLVLRLTGGTTFDKCSIQKKYESAIMTYESTIICDSDPVGSLEVRK